MIRSHINTHTTAQVCTTLCRCPTSSFILIIFAGCVLLIKSQMSFRNNVKLGPYALLTFSFKTDNRLVVEMKHVTFNIGAKKYWFSNTLIRKVLLLPDIILIFIILVSSSQNTLNVNIPDPVLKICFLSACCQACRHTQCQKGNVEKDWLGLGNKTT